MATGNRYSQPTYAQSSQGTAIAPKLGASSDNISGYDQTTAAILDAVKKDAAINGLTAWGLSFLKQLGETIKPEWLKENSKEWFNKPLPDPLVPPKDEFLKLVEPAVRSLTKPSTNASERGVMVGGGWTEAIRDKGGFGGLWEKYHKEVGDLDQQYAQLPEYLDPIRTAAKNESIREASFDRLRNNYSAVIEKYDLDPEKLGLGSNDPAAKAQAILQSLHQGNRIDDATLKSWGVTNYTPADWSNTAATPPPAMPAPVTPPQAGFNPAGVQVNQSNRTAAPLAEQLQGWTGDPTALEAALGSAARADAQAKLNKQFEKENEVRFDRKDAAAAGAAWQLAARMAAAPTTIAPTTTVPPQDSAAQKTFLPPYLQPGAPTDANNITGAKLPVATQIASPTPIAPPITPFTPLMPQGFATPRPVTPGLFPAMAGMPRAGGFGGGFGATAKLLELPYYLRQLTGKAY